MRAFVLVPALVVAATLVTGPALLQETGPSGPGGYDVVEGWLQPFADDGFAFIAGGAGFEAV